MDALRKLGLKTIVKIAYEIAIGKRGISDTKDNKCVNEENQDDDYS